MANKNKLSTNKDEKSTFVGFRLKPQFINRLDQIASQTSKSRGLVAKDAVKQWINLDTFNQTNEMITVSKTLFCKLLSILDEEQMKDLAQEIADLMADIMRFLVAKPMNEDSLRKYESFTITFFGKSGLKWFNTIKIESKESQLIFSGLHDLTVEFSEFFTHFYKHLLVNHFDLDYVSKIEDTSPNLVNLQFHLKND